MIRTSAITITTAATRLDVHPDDARSDQQVVIQGPAEGAVYVGGQDVTSSTGLELVAGAVLSLTTDSPVYAVASAGAVQVRVMQIGVA